MLNRPIMNVKMNALCALLPSAFIAFLADPPLDTKISAMIALWMMFVDTTCGWVVALRSKELRSSILRERLSMKIVQFSIILTFFFALVLLFHSWTFGTIGFTCLIILEAHSLMEKLIVLENHGGVKLGPISPFLKTAGSYFQIGERATTVTTVFKTDHTEVTTIPSNGTASGG